MGTGAWVAVIAGVAVAVGGVAWWVHSNSKVGTTSQATPPKGAPATNQTGAIAVAGAVSTDVNELSGAFSNVSSGLEDLGIVGN